MSDLPKPLAGLRAELGTRPVLALLVVLAGLILVVETGLRIRDARLGLVAENERLAARVARLEHFEAPNAWRARFEDLEALNDATRRRLWHAETPGLGRAELSRFLERLQRQARWEEARIEVGRPLPVEDVDGLWRIEGRVNGFAAPVNVLRFLDFARRDPRFFHLLELTIAAPPERRGQSSITFAIFLATGAAA